MSRSAYDYKRHPNDPNTSTALQRAHKLMELGSYTEAAQAYEQLSTAAEERNKARQPFFVIQAGRARLLLRENSACMAHFRRGLELFAAGGRYAQLYHIGNRLIQELKARGMEKEAQEISAILHSNSAAIAESPTQRGPDPSKLAQHIPTHCQSCGGLLRPDELEWIDALSAECPFCGGPVRVE